jgi:ketosteroid isomerase-like protein
MNRIEAHKFSENWIHAWNRRDVNAVLEHYVEDAKFVSPKAATFVGNPVVEGKKALSQYWHVASEKIEKIEFKLDHIVWDSESNELVIFYEANLNGVCSRACEVMNLTRPAGRCRGRQCMERRYRRHVSVSGVETRFHSTSRKALNREDF